MLNGPYCFIDVKQSDIFFHLKCVRIMMSCLHYKTMSNKYQFLSHHFKLKTIIPDSRSTKGKIDWVTSWVSPISVAFCKNIFYASISVTSVLIN